VIRSVVKARTTRAVRQALRSLWSELQIQHQHRLALRKLRRYRDRSDLKLNLGCGSNVKPGWLNIDLSPPADLQLDLRESLPFPDSSVCMIYSEHFVEHLTLEDARRLMRDSLRVLKPGGLFSVGVPDAELPLTAYVMRDDEFFRSARDRGHPPSYTTRMHHVNYVFRQGNEHKYAYDLETLTDALSAAGFVAITRRPFDPTLDSERRRIGTLYVDARKPGSGGGQEPAAQ
jgi:predicted SAM-dependent methyltransferase